ncbi:hypothetical protein BOTBODRAFT_622811 [Botryobasidium botryosum FD-172 SS1]|uniref:DUF6589 domain-containing protein n=1 Tax=Botryobasidium botryosum (strain FD-172 SS1) TaxID=930990 RepID=A0A067ML44_BOTB1|nr:hypothetical protein BOTBODRAFT_622811 [Botryobasidium botryosum FD-172 SS1]
MNINDLLNPMAPVPSVAPPITPDRPHRTVPTPHSAHSGPSETRPRFEQVRAVLACLQEQSLTLASFLDFFLWGDPVCTSDNDMRYLRMTFCGDPLLPKILGKLYERPQTSTSGKRIAGASSLVREWAHSQVRSTLARELVKFSATLNNPGLSEEAFNAITMDSILQDVQRLAPGLYSLLSGLARSDAQASKNTQKSQLITIMACQLAYSRNVMCNKFQQLIGLYMKTKSVPSKCMELVHHFGLSMSYSWVSQSVGTLRDAAVADLHAWLEDGSVFILHDNIRLAFRVKTQRVNNQAHGDNGTAATAVALPESARKILSQYGELMRPLWPQIRAAFADTSPQPIRMLSVSDLTEQLEAARLREFSVHNVIRVLLSSPEFTNYKHRDHPSLQSPTPIDALPTGPNHRTKQWMLGTVPIEEATYSGNLQVVDNILGQLGFKDQATMEKLGLGEKTIPWGGDQLTDSRLKILKWLRAGDVNGFERKDWMVNFFGWFHTVMILANAIYDNHRGTPKDFGFARDIGLLGIKGLASTKEKPMFHTIDDLLHLEHTARVQTGWLWASEKDSLSALFQALDADITPAWLVSLAEKIVDERASSAALVTLQELPTRDYALEGSVILLRDLDLYVQVRQAIRMGDVGQLHSVIPQLIFYFKGGSNGNYCKMLIEYMQWYRYESPPEISSNATWSYVTKISPAIPTLNGIGDHVDKTFGLIHGTRHAEPSPGADLQMLRMSFGKAKMLTYDPKYHNTDKLACADNILKGVIQLQDTTYLRQWWTEWRTFMAHRSGEQTFEAPPDSEPLAQCEDEEDLFFIVE